MVFGHWFWSLLDVFVRCTLAVMTCLYEICRVLWHAFLFRFTNEMSLFLVIMRCTCKMLSILLHDFRTRYPDKISWLF